jgi:hypothetical protein
MMALMQEYDSKCLKMYLITLKVSKNLKKSFVLITKVEGQSNTPCPKSKPLKALEEGTNGHLCQFKLVPKVGQKPISWPNGGSSFINSSEKPQF